MKICSKKMEIPNDFKDKLETTLGIKGVEYTYIPGELIHFEKTNIDCVNPNKIIVKKSNKEIMILFYGEYYYEEEAFFIYDIHNKCTWNRLKEIMA